MHVLALLAVIACQSPAEQEREPDAAVDHDAGHELDASRPLDAAIATVDAGVDAAVEQTVEELCGTPTMAPERSVIDPDDPTYSDAQLTNEEVRAAFAQARAEDSDAYHAYRTAHQRPDLMYCGFCTCGCDESIGHQSGIDCFKDMHGFG